MLEKLRVSGKFFNLGALIARLAIGAVYANLGAEILSGGPEFWARTGKVAASIGLAAYPTLWGLLLALFKTFGGALFAIGFAFRAACFLLLASALVEALAIYDLRAGFMEAFAVFRDSAIIFAFLLTGPGAYAADALFSNGDDE